jgi:prepilin-type N-terminal cleavage/methylation domain-containing protein
MRKTKRDRGFTLIEVLVAIFLVTVAVLGLAQLFLIAVVNNRQADRVANATFLAQQQIEWLRGLTAEELSLLDNVTDEVLDLNQDGTNDYRRITEIVAASGVSYEIGVHVYSAEKISIPAPETLLDDPEEHRPRAFITTIITR